MCGIAGILNFKNQPVTRATIRQMTCALSHRGPDADGFFIDNEVGLGHRRLSIIDLSDAANQPFTDNSGRSVMIFNGEIHNFSNVMQLLKNSYYQTTNSAEV